MTVSFSVVLTDTHAAQRLWSFLKNNWEAMAQAGKPLEVLIGEHRKKRTLWQNKKLHGLCETISKQVFIAGKSWTPKVWKRQLKIMFLPSEDIIMPITGEVISEPISTAELDVDEFAKFILEIEAYATQELGVNILAYGG